MRNKLGQFKRGHHWRKPKPYWNREWLYNEYVIGGLSSSEIASDFGCHPNNILHFLHKHNIERRDVAEAREIKHWGACGKDNPMFGRHGNQNPNWKGGITPERQALYASSEWAEAVSQVWQRDNATCQRCGKYAHGKGNNSYHIHHIVSFEVEQLRAEPGNLILLCRDCHNWVHSKDNADKDFINDG